MIALRTVGCTRVFAEKIFMRGNVRPEVEAALALCRDIRSPSPVMSGCARSRRRHRMADTARDAYAYYPDNVTAVHRARGAAVSGAGSAAEASAAGGVVHE